METGATPILRREPPPLVAFNGIIPVKTPSGKIYEKLKIIFQLHVALRFVRVN
jgi:hypothetical protein